MGVPFIPLARTAEHRSVTARACLLVLAMPAASLAQQSAPLEWTRIDDACPAYLRAASAVIVEAEPPAEMLRIGGVRFDRRGTMEREGARIEFEAPPFSRASWSLRLTTSHCTAIGRTAEAQPMSPDAAAEARERAARLQRADELLAEMRAAAEKEDPPRAAAAARSACEERRAALGPDHSLVATCLLQLGTRALFADQHAEAFEVARKAHAVFARIRPGERSLEALEARNLEAQALFYLSRPAEMHAAAREAYEGRKRILGAAHADTILSHGLVAIALRRLGRLEEAIPIYEEVARLREETQGPAAIDTLRAKSNLSAALQERGDWDRVVTLQGQVYSARRASQGESHPTTLVSTHDYASALWDAGRAAEALALAERSLPLFPERFGEDHLQTLRIKTLLGTIYSGIGRDDEAVPLLREVYAARRRSLGDAHRNTALAARNLAEALMNLDRADEGLALIEAALARLPSGAQRDRATELEVHQVRAYALLRLGQPAKALETFERELDTRAMNVAQVRTATPDQLANAAGWAQAYFELGRHDLAIPTAEALYLGSRERFGAEHALTLQAMATLASMYSDAGNIEAALPLLSEFVERSEHRLQEGISASSLNRGRLLHSVQERPHVAGYRTYARLLADRDPVKALEIAELTKARSLAETLVRSAADEPRLQDARMRFARAEERVAASDVGSSPYLYAVAERSRAEDELRKAMPQRLRRSFAIDVRDSLRSALAPGAAFVSYVVSGDRVLAIASTGAGRVRAKDLGPIPGLADQVEAFRRVLTSPAPASERLWSLPDGSVRWSLSRPAGATRLADTERVGRELSRRLLEPLAAELGTARTWIVSPDGPLAFLPFEALRLGREAVLESRTIRYAPSLASLAAMPAIVASAPRRDFLGIGVSRFRGGSMPWSDLPRAEAEVGAIGQMFGEAQKRVLVGAAASESALRELDVSGELRRYRFIHLATHAFLSAKGASLSGVVLSGGEEGKNDGVVTAAEWPTYRLGSDLVVLSACDTGLGRPVAGEGIVGLPHAMLLAGSRAVLLTLWSVPDASAAEFMPKFYRRMVSGKNPAEALRETKLEFARSRGPWSSPRHWAPYVLYGAS